jgi:hypothetical protein
MENGNIQPQRPFILQHGCHYVSRGIGIVGPMREKVIGPSTDPDGGIIFTCMEEGFTRQMWHPNGRVHGGNGDSLFDLLVVHPGKTPKDTLRMGAPFETLTPGQRYMEYGGYVHGPLVLDDTEGQDAFTAPGSPGLVWTRDGRVRGLREYHPRNLRYRVPLEWGEGPPFVDPVPVQPVEPEPCLAQTDQDPPSEVLTMSDKIERDPHLILKKGGYYVSHGAGMIGPMIEHRSITGYDRQEEPWYGCASKGLTRLTWHQDGRVRGSNGNDHYDLLREHVVELTSCGPR